MYYLGNVYKEKKIGNDLFSLQADIAIDGETCLRFKTNTVGYLLEAKKALEEGKIERPPRVLKFKGRKTHKILD